MNKIISKERFSEKVFKFEIEAPLIAKSRKVRAIIDDDSNVSGMSMRSGARPKK